MDYRAIIQEAWAVTRQNKSLIWWFAFLPSLLTTTVGVIYLSYQAYSFWTSPFLNPNSDGGELFSVLFDFARNFFRTSPSLAVLVIVGLALLAVLYLMLPVFTQGALIQVLSRAKQGKPISVMEGIGLGLRRFLQLFEYNLLVQTFSVFSVFTELSFVFRSFGPETFKIFFWIFLIVFIVSFTLTMLFTFSENYIVLDDEPIFGSMVSSSALVARHWHHTIFMFLLMMLISVRLIINILLSALIPLLFIGPVVLFAGWALTGIGVALGAVLGLAALIATSYFVGVFHVFTTAVWTFTFEELKGKS